MPAGHADVFDEQAQQLLFLGVIEGVDDGVDAGGEVVHAGSELIVAGEGGAFVSEAGSLVLAPRRLIALSADELKRLVDFMGDLATSDAPTTTTLARARMQVFKASNDRG